MGLRDLDEGVEVARVGRGERGGGKRGEGEGAGPRHRQPAADCDDDQWGHENGADKAGALAPPKLTGECSGGREIICRG